jgi:hypothetical protein
MTRLAAPAECARPATTSHASALADPCRNEDAALKVCEGAPHRLANTTAFKDRLNADLLAFPRT